MSSVTRRIDLLRHGEVLGGNRFRGSQDDPLTAEGWAQMEAAAGEKDDWDAVVTSPLSRCHAYAAVLAERRKIPLVVETRLREIHFGAWEGRTYAELMASHPRALTAFLSDPFNQPPAGAENLETFVQRVQQGFESVANGQLGHRVLVITHGGVVRVLLCHARDWPLSQLLKIEVPHASLQSLAVQGDGCWREQA